MYRLFISIPLESHFQKAFEVYRDAYGRPTRNYLRWTPLANFHVTVLFIGAVPAEQVPAVQQHLQQVATETDPFALVLDRITYAPPGDQMKTMVWTLFRPEPAFDALVERCIAALENTVAHEDAFARAKNGKGRAKQIHVTLARFRDPRHPPREWRTLKPTGLEGQALGVGQIQLMTSERHPDGARYQQLARLQLGSDESSTLPSGHRHCYRFC